MKLTAKLFVKVALGAALAVGVSTAVTFTASPAHAAAADAPNAEVGAPAPDFTLTDLDGKEHTLSDYTDKGKTVVLMWFSPDCPFVVKHYDRENMQTFNTMKDEYAEKGVVFLAVNSAKAEHPYGKPERSRERAGEWDMNWPILMDPSGKVGKMYNAKRTPEMYVIDADGMLVYHGAIDNDSSGRGIGDVNYVEKALDETLAGETVTTPKTTAYGCTVKY
jgi:peroxiredoxin